MSTRRSRQLGNKYIKAEDIQKFIYDSEEEDPNEVLTRDRDEKRESRNKGALKAGASRDREPEDNSKFLGHVDFSVINRQERESATESGDLNESLKEWYGDSQYKVDNKLNDPLSKEQEIQERKSEFNCFVSTCTETNSEGKVNSGELNWSEHSSKDIFRQLLEANSEDDNLFQTVRKRRSAGDRLGISVPKRFKVELDKEMTDAPANKPLKIEVELEKNRRNEPIKKRNINMITEELDEISKRWNDNYSRYKPSFQWGTPIIKNCNEKWDFHYFPQKIFEFYPKRLAGNYCQSVRTGESSHERDRSGDCKIVEARGVRVESGKIDEEGSDALDYEQYITFSGNEDSVQGDMHSYNSDGHGKMSLRSSNLNRNRQDGRNSNDTTMSEQLSKEKALKNSNKDQKKLNNSGCQLVVKVERCQDPHRQFDNKELVDSDENFEDGKGIYEDYGSSSQMNACKAHYEENSAQGSMRMNEDDKVACPICQEKFEKNRIEAHANQCATAAFQD